jgi:hypothetical protein
MELVLKMPKGKHPFIGVRYNLAKDANSLNQELVGGGLYTLHVTPRHRKHDARTLFEVLIELRSSDQKKTKVYIPYYNPEEFKEWYKAVRSYIHFNFGQVYSEKGEDRIARTESGKPFVVKICGLFLEETP